MSAISRREFLKNAVTHGAAASFLSAAALELRASPLGMPIGCQTWPVRAMIAKDFPGTIKQLAGAGFQTIELCSPGVTPIRASQASPNTREPSSGEFSPMQVSHV